MPPISARAPEGALRLLVRNLRPEDRAAVRSICFETGMMGDPIVDQYGDFESFADMFTAYYTDVEPENSVVGEIDGQVVGYMLCALDQRKVKTPAQYMLEHALTRGICLRPGTFRFSLRSTLDTFGDLGRQRAPKVDLDLYPSSPHINLLGPARRGGGATEMFYRVFDNIVSRGSKGMHGSVQATNRPLLDLAMKKLGFQLVGEPFPVQGLRDTNGQRVSLQTLARTLTDWEVGAWEEARLSHGRVASLRLDRGLLYPRMIALIYAHPYPDRSRANRTLLQAVAGLPELEVRSLYDLYPDFGIDVEAEQELLLKAHLIVWQHPLYWYSVPGLLKHWFDKVLARGWAYGDGGNALRGKTCLWVTTTGGDEDAFSPEGMHAFPFGAFVPPIEQTARFCQMHWAPPLVLHGAHRVDMPELRTAAERYRQTLTMLSMRVLEREGAQDG